ncbi:MAG: oligopeptide/dipeptide ABC transporter ATP-binding protein [bacterium]|jgi:oligopeptide/dipeptide ABC transporter ATP-binding protein
MACRQQKDKPVLEVQNLITSFQVGKQRVPAVRDVSFDVYQKETVGIIGESGCGKSVTSFSIMRLVPHPLGKIEQGKVFLGGNEILGLDIQEFRKLRGNQLSMIFQEPMTSLNPVLKIGKQLIEPIREHSKLSKKEAWQRSIELLDAVGLSDPELLMYRYPHQLSGGMKQRIMIAMALTGNPKVLIADEPTTALDVTIQAQILHLLKKIQNNLNMSMIMITHDMGVIAQTCDYVLVMYAGRIVEQSSVLSLFDTPLHPYTQGLLKSLVSSDQVNKEKLFTIAGTVPSLTDLPIGCSFQNRCSRKTQLCIQEAPELQLIEGSHFVACHYPEKSKD